MLWQFPIITMTLEMNHFVVCVREKELNDVLIVMVQVRVEIHIAAQNVSCAKDAVGLFVDAVMAPANDRKKIARTIFPY